MGRGSATCFTVMAYVVPVSTRGSPLSLNSSLGYMTSTQEAKSLQEIAISFLSLCFIPLLSDTMNHMTEVTAMVMKSPSPKS